MSAHGHFLVINMDIGEEMNMATNEIEPIEKHHLMRRLIGDWRDLGRAKAQGDLTGDGGPFFYCADQLEKYLKKITETQVEE